MTIEINGQSHELHFGMKAARYLFEKVAELGADGSAVLDSDFSALLIWAGIVNGAFKQQKSVTTTFGEVLDWVEGSIGDQGRVAIIEAVSKEFAESKVVKAMQGPQEEESEEKKSMTSTSTSSNPSASDISAGQNTNITAQALEPSY